MRTVKSSLFGLHVNVFRVSSLRVTVRVRLYSPAEPWEPSRQVRKPTDYRNVLLTSISS